MQHETEEILKTKERYQNIFQNANDAIYLIDPETRRILDCNMKAAEMTGYAVEELKRMKAEHLHPEDEIPLLPGRFREVYAKGSSPVITGLHHKRKDGVIVAIEISPTMVDVSGKKLNLSVIRDMTERKRAQEALEISEQHHRSLMESARDFVAYRLEASPEEEFQARVVFVSPSIRGIMGVSDPANFAEWFQHIHEDDRPGVSEAQMRSAETGVPFNQVMRINHPGKKELRWLHAISHPVVDTEKQVTYFNGIIVDITDRKRAEEEERKLLRQLKTMYDSLPVGIAYMESDLKFISINPFFLALSGLQEDDVIGKFCYETIGEYAKDPTRTGRQKICSFCRHRECIGIKKPFNTQRTLGDHIVNVTTVPEYDDDGNIVRYLEVIEDITERKALEEQLLQAQKMEAIGQLAGGIAHDFNNILTAIVGYGTIMQMKMDQNDPIRENLDHILTSAERASNLTHSLLAFSRKQIIQTKPVELNTVIRDVSTLLRRVIGEDIILKADLIDAQLMILADRGQIEQVLMNLATNARDAMPDGGTLMLETARTELDEEYARTHGYGEPGRYAVLSITDTGVGMDEEVRERIFEPFFSTKESGRGTGLGLAMAYGIVKQHSGYINVYSEPGKGTTFILYLPTTEAKAERDKASGLAMPEAGSETILVAEDDVSIRSLVKSVLENAGYSVIEAVDGDDAISKFTGNADRVDLLLLDVIMPKRNGKDVFEEIRKARPDIKALFTSGYSTNLIHEKGILKEGIHFIYKPSTPNNLLRKVREVLDL